MAHMRPDVLLVLVTLSAIGAGGCATRVCASRILEAAEVRWSSRACAVPIDETAVDVELQLDATNLAARERHIAAKPVRFSFGRTTEAPDGVTSPSNWATEVHDAGEEFVTIASGTTHSFRRRFVVASQEGQTPVRRGETLYLGVTTENPSGDGDATTDLGEFTIAVDPKGAAKVALGREPLGR